MTVEKRSVAELMDDRTERAPAPFDRGTPPQPPPGVPAHPVAELVGRLPQVRLPNSFTVPWGSQEHIDAVAVFEKVERGYRANAVAAKRAEADAVAADLRRLEGRAADAYAAVVAAEKSDNPEYLHQCRTQFDADDLARRYCRQTLATAHEEVERAKVYSRSEPSLTVVEVRKVRQRMLDELGLTEADIEKWQKQNYKVQTMVQLGEGQ